MGRGCLSAHSEHPTADGAPAMHTRHGDGGAVCAVSQLRPRSRQCGVGGAGPLTLERRVQVYRLSSGRCCCCPRDTPPRAHGTPGPRGSCGRPSLKTSAWCPAAPCPAAPLRPSHASGSWSRPPPRCGHGRCAATHRHCATPQHAQHGLAPVAAAAADAAAGSRRR